MRYVALLEQGPLAIPGKPLPAHDRTVMAAHLLAMRRLYETGALLFGGPYVHGLAGMALLEAEDEAAAAALMAADPAIAAGIMGFRIEAMRTMFDAFAGEGWAPPPEAADAH